MPVSRIPFATFQYVSPTGSSVTPLPWNNWGGGGYMPFAVGVLGWPLIPWHTAQYSRYTLAPAMMSSSVGGTGLSLGASRLMRAFKAIDARRFSKGNGGPAVATGAYPNRM